MRMRMRQNGEQTASCGGRRRIIIMVSVLFLDKVIGSGRTMVDGRHSTTYTAASGSDNAAGYYRTAGIPKSSVSTIETGRTDHHPGRRCAYNGLWRQCCMHLIATLGSCKRQSDAVRRSLFGQLRG